MLITCYNLPIYHGIEYWKDGWINPEYLASMMKECGEVPEGESYEYYHYNRYFRWIE